MTLLDSHPHSLFKISSNKFPTLKDFALKLSIDSLKNLNLQKKSLMVPAEADLSSMDGNTSLIDRIPCPRLHYASFEKLFQEP